MRIAILIPSRNRPRRVCASLTMLDEMASGRHEIEYHVGYDSDDEYTVAAIPRVEGKFFGHEAPDHILTIGGIWNELAQKTDADVYSCLIDDAFCVTPCWDLAIAGTIKKCDVLSWYEVGAPGNTGYPTCTKRWLKACGYIVPEQFPFWFMDTWFQEVAEFATEKKIEYGPALFSKQEETQNLRDLDFWWGFFNATRMLRYTEAARIRKKLNCGTPGSVYPLFQDFIARDTHYRGAKIAEIEKKRRALTLPGAKYIQAKKNAEAFLIANDLKLWGG